MENKSLVKTETTQVMNLWKSDWKGQMSTVRVTKEMTFSELRALDTPSVSMMNVGEKTPENGIRIFQAWVLNIVKFLGAEWTTEQVLECGKICFDEAHYLTFAELSHFAQKAKSGGFEKVYGKFTPATFMEWFVTYCSENLEQRKNYFMNEKPLYLPPENPVSEELVLSAFRDIKDKLNDEMKADGTYPAMDEDEYQRIRAEYITGQMQKKVENNEKPQP